MKYLVMILGLAITLPATADVKVSVRIGDPLFFGRVDIGGAPPPALLLPRPVIIEPPAVQVEMEPLYLHVRPEESRNWRNYCHRYNACGRQVYFVQDRWYRNVYIPHYHSHHEEYERREHEWREHENHDHHEHRPPPPPAHHDEHHDHDRHDHHDDHHDNDHHDHDHH